MAEHSFNGTACSGVKGPPLRFWRNGLLSIAVGYVAATALLVPVVSARGWLPNGLFTDGEEWWVAFVLPSISLLYYGGILFMPVVLLLVGAGSSLVRRLRGGSGRLAIGEAHVVVSILVGSWAILDDVDPTQPSSLIPLDDVAGAFWAALVAAAVAFVVHRRINGKATGRSPTWPGTFWAVSNDDQIQVDGSPSEPASQARGWLILGMGLVVGVAIGVVFSQSSGTTGLNGGSGTAATTTPMSLVTPNASSTAQQSTTTNTRSSDVEEVQARLVEIEAALARAEEEVLELGLRYDPARYAPTIECLASQGNHYDAGYREDSYFVGPIGFHDLIETLAAPVAAFRVFAGVEAGDSVTLVVPERYRGVYALLWTDATQATSVGANSTMASGVTAVTLRACGATTLFEGGFVTTSRNYCAPLDVYFGDSSEPVRIILPFDGVACPDGSMALVAAEPGPLPDVVGMSLREARLAIRLTDLFPSVNVGDPLEPTGIVWGQEPNDGAIYEPGAKVRLRTCRSAAEIESAFQSRFVGTGVMLSNAWMTPSHDQSLDSWWFVSARVSGGASDGQIATWALPEYPGVADENNTPGLSIPANSVAELFGFGERRFTPEDYGVEDWLDFDGGIGSQRCVEASAGVASLEIVCPIFEEVRSDRDTDTLDEQTIERLLDVLPDEFHDEVALFYYPLGGPVGGLDTSGAAAQNAGRILDDLYQRNC